MIEPRHPRLSVARQCELVSISRSGFYYQPAGETPLNLALMRLIDVQFLETPWYGSRQMARHLRREGYTVGRKRMRRLMARMGLEPTAAAHDDPASWASDPSISAAGHGDRPTEPSLVRRHNLHPDASRLSLFGRDHGLVDAKGSVLAIIEHHGR
jgi:hypothetical protein